MKHSIFTAFTGIFLLAAANFKSYGQVAASTTDSAEPAGKFKTNKVYNNEINSRARKDFMNRFKNVSNEKWTVTDMGFSVRFTIGEIRYNIRYDKKGNCLFNIRSYSEKYLAKNIRTLVRSTYFDYNIKWVEEIEKPFYPVVYVVLLEGDKEWIKVRVGDGELNELEKIDK
jgi:hypothetical protein